VRFRVRIGERRAFRGLAFLLGILLCDVPCAFPWGSHGHRLVNGYAVDNLPSEMVDDGSGNAFGDRREYLADHASDPDWQKEYDVEEGPRHWCDIDSLIYVYPPPFDTVPRECDEYVGVFGRANGIVPWEGIRDHYESLVALMQRRNWYAAYQCAAELGHYVADAAVPLHATVHYDGYRPWHPAYDERSEGIHERYESDMISLFIDSLSTVPGSACHVEDVVEMGFEIITGGWYCFDEVLDADLEVQDIVGDRNFNEVYYEELFAEVGDEAQARLDYAAQRLADLWYSAWVDAGCPSFQPGRIMISFQPITSTALQGWWFDCGLPFGPLGAHGWR